LRKPITTKKKTLIEVRERERERETERGEEVGDVINDFQKFLQRKER